MLSFSYPVIKIYKFFFFKLCGLYLLDLTEIKEMVREKQSKVNEKRYVCTPESVKREKKEKGFILGRVREIYIIKLFGTLSYCFLLKIIYKPVVLS